ncbi:MAG: glycosyltransferase [bacterium]
MRVLHVGGPRERTSRAPVRWAGLELQLVRSQFDQLVRYNHHTPEMMPRVSRERLTAFADAAHGFEAIFCETPEALLLFDEWQRRGLTQRPLVALEVEGLLRVDAMRRWYRYRGGDPWPALCRAPHVSWLAASSVQQERLAQGGVPQERIFPVRGCTAHFGMFVQDIERQLGGDAAADASLAQGLPRDAVLLPGGGRRDHVTALRAAGRLPGLTFVLIDELLPRKQHQLREAGISQLPNLYSLKPLSLERFIALVRRARLVVVSLQPGQGDGGHTTVATAHRLGVPVIVTDVPGIADYVTDGVDARLVPPGDPSALAAAIEELWNDPAQTEAYTAAGRRTEATRCEAAPGQHRAALKAACEGLDASLDASGGE